MTDKKTDKKTETETTEPSDKKKKTPIEQADAKVQTAKTKLVGSARMAYNQAVHHVGFPAIEIADKVAALEAAVVAREALKRKNGK